MKRNIVLCGFMGCGKTTIGRCVARELGMELVDLDDVIRERAGIEIPAIFAQFGEDGFRDREHEAVLEMSRRSGIVLATGGGALTCARNVSPLKESGAVVYLNAGFEECYRRIRRSDRPLVRANSKEQLAALYAQRQEKYRAAMDLEVKTAARRSVSYNAGLVLDRLGEEGLL